MYIAFEGIDGSGKSSVVEAISEVVASKGKDVLPIRMPGHTKLGSYVRNTWHKNDAVRFLSLTANHVEVIEEFIEPHLASGGWVIQDRTYLSNHVYFGLGSKLNYGFVSGTSSFWIGRKPDIIFLLDCSAEVATERLLKVDKDLPDPSKKDLAYLRLAYKIEVGAMKQTVVIETEEKTLEEVTLECLTYLSPFI